MRSRLPPYIVNCLLVAGFDTLDVLAKMDVGREPGNLIQMDHLPDDAHLNETPFIPPRIITGRGGNRFLNIAEN